MRRIKKPVHLTRETLRHLSRPAGSELPPATFPDTMLPDNCYTTSCHTC